MHLRAVVACLFAFAAAAACSSFESDGGSSGVSADGGDDGTTTPLQDGAADADTDALVNCTSTAPQPEAFESPGGAVTSLTTDGAYVYWILNNQIIQRRAVASGPIETIHSDVAPLSAIAVVSGFVVYSAPSATYSLPNVPDAGASTLNSGDAVKPMFTYDTMIVGHGVGYIERLVPPSDYVLVAAESNPSGVAVNAAKIFFTAAGGDAGSERSVYAVDNAPAYYQTRTQIFHAAGTDPSRLAADTNDLFLVDVAAERVFKIPVAGGADTTLATGQPDLGNIAVRGDYVYYTTSVGFRRVAKAGGCWTAISNDPVQEFTVTSQHAYFVKGTDIVRVKL